jgi:hypothetical protein
MRRDWWAGVRRRPVTRDGWAPQCFEFFERAVDREQREQDAVGVAQRHGERGAADETFQHGPVATPGTAELERRVGQAGRLPGAGECDCGGECEIVAEAFCRLGLEGGQERIAQAQQVRDWLAERICGKPSPFDAHRDVLDGRGSDAGAGAQVVEDAD